MMVDALFGKQATDLCPIPGKINMPDFSSVVEYREATGPVVDQVHAIDDCGPAWTRCSCSKAWGKAIRTGG